VYIWTSEGELIGFCGKWHNEELHFSSNNIKMLKLRRMGLARRMVGIGRVEVHRELGRIIGRKETT
jgi:hypothetical protein